ncbi:MAG: transglutaminase family protein [Acidimicrobiales bacterium]
MSWQVAIRHRTAYTYAGEVRSSYNEARVTPLTTDWQQVVEAATVVSPAANVLRYWDYWGTLVDAFDVHESHSELAVTGSSVVKTSPPVPRRRAGWDELKHRDVTARFVELLSPTGCVPPVEELDDVAASMAASAPSPVDACDAAVDWVRGRLRYQSGVTNVTTTASQALAGGAGVCQDFAHVTVGLLRSMGIPARYASGYAFPSPDVEIGVDVDGQSHAWVEAWTGDWYALDPTHGMPVGPHHVLVGRGRDYADVPPLKGIYRGAPAERLTVTVELTRVS